LHRQLRLNADSEDLVHDVVLWLIERQDYLKAPPKKTYLFTSVKRAVMDVARSWSGIGRIGMARHGFGPQLTRYDERGWRATRSMRRGWSTRRRARPRRRSAHHGMRQPAAAETA
jgi:DNA-directed RNA polymerase specialized sigma24 family protein